VLDHIFDHSWNERSPHLKNIFQNILDNFANKWLYTTRWVRRLVGIYILILFMYNSIHT